jgi:hypothetical protein
MNKIYYWRVQVQCVGWPPLLPDVDNYYANFREFNFSVLPFWGKYNGKAFPESQRKNLPRRANLCAYFA